MINFEDINLDVIKYIGEPRTGKDRIRAFLSVYDTCSEHALNRATTASIISALKKANITYIPTEEDDPEEDVGISSEAKICRMLCAKKLTRRITMYDRDEEREVEYLYLTGKAHSLFRFLEDFSRDDLREVKDTNIRDAVLNAESLSSQKERTDPADCIMDMEALEKNVFELIEHLSTYNAGFTDFVESLGKELHNRKTFGKAIQKLMESNYILEYHFFMDNMAYYLSCVNKIAIKCERIIADKNKIAELTQSYMYRYKSQNNDQKKDPEAIILERLAEVIDMCRHDYPYHIEQITNRVRVVIMRIEKVADSFSVSGRDTLCVELLKMSKVCSEKGITFPQTLLDTYFIEIAYDGSIHERKVITSKEEVTYEEPEYTDTASNEGMTEDSSASLELSMETYFEQYVPYGKKVNIKDMPCSSHKEFYFIVTLLNNASGRYKNKEYQIVENESQYTSARNTYGYLLPHIVVERI